MLLRDEASISVRNLRAEPHTDRAVLIFYVEKKGGKVTMPGPEVVKRLKEKLRQDSGLLQLSVANIDTAVCQNNCSGKYLSQLYRHFGNYSVLWHFLFLNTRPWSL